MVSGVMSRYIRPPRQRMPGEPIPPIQKPRLRCYPSPVPADHCVLVTPYTGTYGYKVAVWFYKGVEKVKPWLIRADDTEEAVRQHLRRYQPCDIFIVEGQDL